MNAEQADLRWDGADTPTAVVAAAREAIEAGTRPTRIILIDGLSGAGKTVFDEAFRRGLVEALADAEPSGGLPVRRVSPDLWYPGWDGLEAGIRESERIVADLAAGRDSWYRPWDWDRSIGLDPVPIEAGGVAVVEGCGSLTPATRALADFAIWVEAEGGAARRYERAIGRDGEIYRPWWDRWAAQDEARVERDRPRELADVVVLT